MTPDILDRLEQYCATSDSCPACAAERKEAAASIRALRQERDELRSRLADIEAQNRVMWDVANDREARLAEAERDAARYREWKRAFREGECGLWNALCDANSNAEHDAAIDAAMAADSATHRETPVT